ncbi:MAG: GspH/FimT family pseudopilin [Armatimonadetes bacterium]|nr:GspH/FimT family pseudopilin [Armatimonadota bacterium]
MKTRHGSGFTMTELAIVLGLIAVLTVLMVPNFVKFRGDSAVKMAAQDLVGNLRYARQLSMSRGGGVQVAFDAPSSLYTIRSSTGSTLKQVSYAKGVQFLISGVAPPITFAANGAIPANGTIVVSGSQSSRTYTIDLQQGTGVARLRP